MKKILFFLSLMSVCMLYSCTDIYDNIKKYATEETIYVGKFDEPRGYQGFERVEIDLLDAGRIPSSQIKLGKAKKTVVEYDDKVITYDSVMSWVNITGLTVPKLYRFKIYNVDDYGNKSVAVETALIPYTAEERDALVFPSPMLAISPTAAEFEWPNGLSSGFFDFAEIVYSFPTKDGIVADTTQDTKFVLTNLKMGEIVPVSIICKIIPKINGEVIIDTIDLERTISITSATPEEYLESREKRSVSEAYIVGSNGKITWGEATNHLIYSELRYKTIAGGTEILRTLSTIDTLECPDAKPGELIEVRSAFVPTATADTFVSGWQVYKYPFLYKYPRTEWTAEARNGNHGWIPDGDGGTGKGGQPVCVFDGNTASGWHSRVGAPLPQCLAIDMKESLNINHIMVQPPFTATWCYVQDLEIYLSDTPMSVTGAVPDPSWGNPVIRLRYPYGSTGKNWDIDFPTGTSARYVALVFPTSGSGSTYISFMEFVVYGDGN
jgi:hypothetical protein